MKKTVVVGLNIGHDGGAAIVVDGKVICAISEERLNRQRYSHGYLQSFFYCLKTARVTINDISLIVFSSYGNKLPEKFQGELKILGLPESKFTSVDHHLSHAYGAYFLSPFKDALVVIIDGEGNNSDTESYYLGKEQTLSKIGGNDPKRPEAQGIGRTYEAFTNFLGWTDQDAGKTMGLAPFTDSASIKTPLYEIKNTQVNSLLSEKYEAGAIGFIRKNRLPFGKPYSQGITKQGMLTAAYVQKQTERIVIELIKRLVGKTGKRKLCLAGGVALNSCINTRLIQEKIVDDIFILPAASDRGQPLGNALYGYHKLTSSLPRNPLRHDYFGREYSQAEILAALQRDPDANVRKVVPKKNLVYEQQKNIAKITANLISEGKIIGWFQGGSELGPRALGHRGMVCDPRHQKMKQWLNERVKHREPFRPFAPSCLLEKAAQYYDFPLPSPYMLFVLPVREKYRSTIPAVTHVDYTGRLQTTTGKDNGIYHDLIKEFYRLTGVPVILETSFNDNEPIVETPGDAVSTFLRTEIDYLAIGNYLVWKE